MQGSFVSQGLQLGQGQQTQLALPLQLEMQCKRQRWQLQCRKLQWHSTALRRKIQRFSKVLWGQCKQRQHQSACGAPNP